MVSKYSELFLHHDLELLQVQAAQQETQILTAEKDWKSNG